MTSVLPPGKAGGFSLIELLVAMAIAAILISLALPSFNDAIGRNRIVAQVNEFIAATNLARTEAIRRNAAAGVCASSDGSTCGGAWANGWIVWVDGNRDGNPGAGEALRSGAFSSQDTVAGATLDIRFNARGRRTLPTTGVVTLSLQPPHCMTGHARTL
jgi:type IV fimbrial biogenesis protein FimT